MLMAQPNVNLDIQVVPTEEREGNKPLGRIQFEEQIELYQSFPNCSLVLHIVAHLICCSSYFLGYQLSRTHPMDCLVHYMSEKLQNISE